MKKSLVMGCIALSFIAGFAFSGCGDAGNSATPPEKSQPTAGQQSRSKETPFVVTVPHMQDEGCVASINETVSKVAGVDSIECDIPNKKAKVYPKKGATISMKELWEAFDDAGESASKIDGPTGMFTTKPDK